MHWNLGGPGGIFPLGNFGKFDVNVFNFCEILLHCMQLNIDYLINVSRFRFQGFGYKPRVTIANPGGYFPSPLRLTAVWYDTCLVFKMSSTSLYHLLFAYFSVKKLV